MKLLILSALRVQGNPVNVCPSYSQWYYVTSGANAYSVVEGYASPDDDTSQSFRELIVDDENARLVKVKGCIHRDEGWDYLGCTAAMCTEKQHFRGFEATW